VIVRDGLPIGVVEEVVIVSVEAVPGEMVEGLKDAVAPLGMPLTPNPTEPVKPFKAVALMV
jgi:hypothetical protein